MNICVYTYIYVFMYVNICTLKFTHNAIRVHSRLLWLIELVNFILTMVS